MEKFRHIKQTSKPHTYEGETHHKREKIEQSSEYDLATEIEDEQYDVREFLNSFDEETLKEIFAEHFRKAGSAEQTMNWIPFDKVRVKYDPESTPGMKIDETPFDYGGHSWDEGIELQSNILCDDKDLTLHALIHEECHAISQDRLRFFELIDDNDTVVGELHALKSGVTKASLTEMYDGTDIKKIFFNDVNEGITELLTERIFKEYKKRTGSTIYGPHLTDTKRKTSDTERTIANSKFGGYEREWKNVKLYIGIISALTDVPEDTVEDSFIRTYIRNGTLLVDDSKATEILREINPELPHILYNLINSQEDELTLKDYVDAINGLDIPEQQKTKISVALQRIRDEWGEAYKLAPNEV